MVFDARASGAYEFTFDTALSLGYVDQSTPTNSSWSPTSSAYRLNNFVLETSSDNITWLEYDGITPSNGGNGSTGASGNGSYFSLNNDIISFNNSGAIDYTSGGITPTNYIRVRLKSTNYGSYQYTSIEDVVNNFMVAYVGQDKIIPSIKRTDVMFHAKRGLQEFSYDTLKSINAQELTITPSLSVAIPQDYVNYVNLSWIDKNGVKHIIYPTRLTSSPSEMPIQDSNGIPLQESVEFPDGSIEGQSEQGNSLMEARWESMVNDPNANLYELNSYYGNIYPYWNNWFGQRYGLDPETAQGNGWFTINEREGTFSFSSNLSGQLILLEYISDGLAYDKDTKIPKLAEEALYMHIAYSILASRSRQPEYVVQRFKKDRRAALRNAKIRLSNIKIEEITQVMRGKSKIIK
jgi:hypothetical protein